MSIQFTQFLRPNGERRQQLIDRPADIEAKASELVAAGCRFEIEELRTLEISMECCREDTEGEHETLGMEVCANGPPVLAAVDKMIADAYRLIFVGTPR